MHPVSFCQGKVAHLSEWQASTLHVAIVFAPLSQVSQAGAWHLLYRLPSNLSESPLRPLLGHLSCFVSTLFSMQMGTQVCSSREDKFASARSLSCGANFQYVAYAAVSFAMSVCFGCFLLFSASHCATNVLKACSCKKHPQD